MSLTLFFLGAALLFGIFIDMVQTTFGKGRSGWLTAPLSRALWRAALAAYRRRGHREVLNVAGPTILMMIPLLWTAVLWVGWIAIFSTDPHAVVEAQTRAPTGFWGKAYFAGMNIVTLGTGDMVGATPRWKVLSVIAAFSGLFTITLAVTYLVPIISAAAHRRQLAGYLSTLGRSVDEVLERSWNGKDFSALRSHLQTLCPMIERFTQQHLAYPALHFFHSSDRRTAAGPALARLYDALLVLEYCVPKESQPDPLLVKTAQRSIRQMLQTIFQSFDIRIRPEHPPLPVCRTVERNFDVRSRAALSRLPEPYRDDRRALLALVEDDGWSWRDVSSPTPDESRRAENGEEGVA